MDIIQPVIEKLYKVKQNLKEKYPSLIFKTVDKGVSFWELETGETIAYDLDTYKEINIDIHKDKLELSYQDIISVQLQDLFKSYEFVRVFHENNLEEVVSLLGLGDKSEVIDYLKNYSVTGQIKEFYTNEERKITLRNRVYSLINYTMVEINNKMIAEQDEDSVGLLCSLLEIVGRICKLLDEEVMEDMIYLSKQVMAELQKVDNFIQIVEVSNAVCVFKQEVDKELEVQDSKYEQYEDIKYRGSDY
ncbi:hypothetical protein ACQUY5_27070 [Bacillus cereus]|uniref:hypothetical protein n=1 Tax=Bacillus cereus TaxID=1396 RepID=UPI003D18615E